MAQKYHHGDLKEAVIQVGFDQLDESGHESLSLREIARLAGVSHAAPYRHFTGKSALLHELATRLFADISQKLEQIRMRHDLDADAKLVHFQEFLNQEICLKSTRAKLIANYPCEIEIDIVRNLSQLLYIEMKERALSDQLAKILWSSIRGSLARGQVENLDTFLMIARRLI